MLQSYFFRLDHLIKAHLEKITIYNKVYLGTPNEKVSPLSVVVVSLTFMLIL